MYEVLTGPGWDNQSATYNCLHMISNNTLFIIIDKWCLLIALISQVVHEQLLSSVLLRLDGLGEPLWLGDGNLVDDGVDLEADGLDLAEIF